MNHLKKLLGYIVTMAMVFTLTGVGIGAVHAEDTTYKLSLTNNGQTNHTFEVYQVFTGDLKDSTLSNIQWGNGITDEGKSKLGTASSKAESLIGQNDNSAVARTFANDLVDNNYLQKGTEVTVKPNETQDVTGLAAGYYLVKDKAESQKDQVNGANTLYILKVVKDTTATTKLDVPTVTKKVKDKNDTEGTTSEWQDSADYDIGDTIDYKIDGTLPGNYDKYTTYKYEFTDTMSAGLTYNAPAKLYVVNDSAETEIVNSETKAYYTETSENGTIKWTFSNLKDLKNVTASSIIRVKYSATLNQNAVIGATGNPNTVNLTYSNNPNKTDGGETGKTPDDTNIVFTYEAIFNKVNENKQALAGAKFELFKKVKKTDNTGFDWVSKGNLDPDPTEVSSGKYTYTFKGLDDGEYKLVETQTPAGYNTMEDKIFTIEATHTQDPEKLELTGLRVTGGLISDEGANKNATVDVSKGTISADIVNKSGTELPETGGMGTTLLYVLGGVLVALAAAYVIYTKKHEKA
ncbi:isopeptide-forming domain-containing fimbrial protein [Sharpea azabuensis]|uniref:LPXTG-motif cell wall anchor domain-containing protein/fimbrial isopeptide formation D2 domain-containing protein n=1 Tax=Sharpea azabuensis TaxID=322505 RepID=A0A1H6TJG7_9FIRM|nr:isopeptide-forming domain-containing fimbrial protein [Sharpea azabuensis]SEI76365.1 LPXTG-motif cell wall anchor domain-containing protein/fimbrial isopeptide formation D2 domain-containing protein [Sharpea azabuensis]